MPKNSGSGLRIDFKRGVVEDALLQIRNTGLVDDPGLVEVWTVDVEQKKTQEVLKHLSEGVLEEPVSLRSCKRIRRSEKKGMLSVIVCSVAAMGAEADVRAMLAGGGFRWENVQRREVATGSASGQEVARAWGARWWPVVWTGNPNDQVLKECEFDMEGVRRVLRQISERAREVAREDGRVPVVSAFVSPVDRGRVVVVAEDGRVDGDVLEHSVMRGIREVARREGQRRAEGEAETYLCLDFDVYTTHEPCSMCAMALVHSRVRRCIFVQEMGQTGALRPDSGDGYCLHNRRLLNSKYEVFQWVGARFAVPRVEPEVCC